MTRAADNKRVVTEYVAAFNRGDLDGLCALFAPDATVWGVLGWGTLEQARPIWRQLMDGLRMQLQVDSIIAEGDIVAVRYTERGTSHAPFLDFPVTGRSYELVAMEWFEVKGGLIHRRWGARDSATQMRQLGFALK